MSQPMLSIAAKVSPSYVYLLEARRVTPSLEVARRIAKALGVTVDEAFPPQGKKAA